MTAIDPKWKRQAFVALKDANDNGELLPPTRKKLPGKVRQTVLAQTEGRCGACDELIVGMRFEVDHIKERDIYGTDDLSNLVALHPECHRTKTSARAGVLAHVHRLAKETFSTEEREPSRLRGRRFETSLTKGFDGKVRPRSQKRAPQ